jgi:hypothetical protein
MSVTTKQAWIGFFILSLMALLVLAAAVYWQHVTGVNPLHSLAFVPDDFIHGC